MFFIELLTREPALYISIVVAVVISIVVVWARSGYGGIDLSSSLIGIIHFLSVPGMLAIALLGIHVYQKTHEEA